MVEQFQCGRGHQWSGEAGATTCPVCGAAAETIVLPAGPPDATELASSGPAAPAGDPALFNVPGYEVLRVLGKGGMGVVYHARHRALGREVALKVILAAEHARPQELIRFWAEAETVARLKHPNIVPIYDLGEAHGRPYFTMELVTGGTLKERLTQGPLPDREAAALLLKLARAAECAHAQGVVHRDLKPDNVLLTEGGEPKVTDFGVAKRLTGGVGLTQTGAVVGTPAYMAPEQAAGKKDVGPAADVYALGAMLYECLAGRAPFAGDSMYDTLHRVLTEDPVSPAWFRPGISRDLETICLKCLRKEPERRYAGARELAEDLERYLAGTPVQARPVGAVERTAKWARRRPALAAAYGLSLAALLLAAGGALWYKFDRDAWGAKAEREKETAERQRQLTERDVLADLSEATLLRGQGAWAQAKAAVERAQGRLGAGHFSPEVEAKVRQARADLQVVTRLEEVQAAEGERFDARKTEEGYAAAFRDYGLALDELDPAEAARRIQAAVVREQLVAALDDWIYVQARQAAPGRPAPVELARLRTCVHGADDDPLRRQFRDLAERNDPEARKELERLAQTPKVLEQPPLTLVILGMTLGDLDGFGAEEALLRRARVRYPNDFWVNYALAPILGAQPGRENEALECYWTALALHPQNQSLYCKMSLMVQKMGRTREAECLARKAVELNESFSDAHFILARALDREGEIDEAVAEYQRVIDLEHDDGGNSHWNIALLRQDQGRREEARKEFGQAAEAYRRARDQNPDDARALCDLGQALLRQGRFAEAVQSLRRGDELAARRTEPEPSCQWLKAAQRQAVLDAVLPAVLRGQADPVGPEAAAALAEVAQTPYRRLFAASARLYGRAFSDDPSQAEHSGEGRRYDYRYTAACAAALAAAGQGDDAGGLGAEDRDGLRSQAVQWLRAELNAYDAYAALADDGLAPARHEWIHRQLKGWLANADLAGLRDDAPLARLPQTDQQACRTLWKDVNALLTRTAPPK